MISSPRLIAWNQQKRRIKVGTNSFLEIELCSVIIDLGLVSPMPEARSYALLNLKRQLHSSGYPMH